MQRIIKSRIFTFILGAIIFGSVGVIATNYAANQISYNKNGKATVEDALDDLYIKTKICKRISEGTTLTVGSKYECTLGDKDEKNNYIKRNFFIIAVNSNNTVDLIMERNITEGTTRPENFNDANNYFKTGDGATYTNAWKNVVEIKLPGASMIASAVNGNEHSILNLGNNKWLYNYLNGCDQYGCDENTSLSEPEADAYWTSTAGNENGSEPNRLVRCINGNNLTVCSITGTGLGVRPVITILKSNLY